MVSGDSIKYSRRSLADRYSHHASAARQRCWDGGHWSCRMATGARCPGGAGAGRCAARVRMDSGTCRAPIAPAAVLMAYAVIAHVGVSVMAQGHPKTPWVTAAFGVLSAAVLVPSLLAEYFGRTVNNAVMVVVVSALWLCSGAVAARLTGRIRDAVLSSTLSAQIGSLANVGSILTSCYILKGSALQDRFFRTVGTYEDFARSGISDFGAFVMGDLFEIGRAHV